MTTIQYGAPGKEYTTIRAIGTNVILETSGPVPFVGILERNYRNEDCTDKITWFTAFDLRELADRIDGK